MIDYGVRGKKDLSCFMLLFRRWYYLLSLGLKGWDRFEGEENEVKLGYIEFEM